MVDDRHQATGEHGDVVVTVAITTAALRGFAACSISRSSRRSRRVSSFITERSSHPRRPLLPRPGPGLTRRTRIGLASSPMCCLALTAGVIGPRFALLLWWIFGDKVDAAFSSWSLAVARVAVSPVDDPCVCHRVGAGSYDVSGVWGWMLVALGFVPTLRRTRPAPPKPVTPSWSSAGRRLHGPGRPRPGGDAVSPSTSAARPPRGSRFAARARAPRRSWAR